jgi:hypothetical protein
MSIHNTGNKQRGDSLLLSIFMLLLMTLGLFATMRAVKNDVQTSGALGWHARGKQISEVVLKDIFSGTIAANNVAVPTTLVDWEICRKKTDPAKKCYMTEKNGFKVYSVIQATTATSADGCNYHRVFLHAIESSGVGSQVDTEAVYKSCS